MHFEAIKSSPGLLGHYLEMKDAVSNGMTSLSSLETKVPWGDAIKPRDAPLYLESLRHILLHQNLTGCEVRGVMPSREILTSSCDSLGLIAVGDLTSRLEHRYLAIQVDQGTRRFVQPHVFPFYTFLKRFSDSVLRPFVELYWKAMTDCVPRLNAALGPSAPIFRKKRLSTLIPQFALELRSELLVKAIVCAAQMRLHAAGQISPLHSGTSCPLFPVLLSPPVPGSEANAADWAEVSKELDATQAVPSEITEIVSIARSRLNPDPSSLSASSLIHQRAEAVLRLLQGGSRVIEPSDPSNAGSDLSVFTAMGDGTYHVDLIEVKYGSGGSSKLGDLGMKYLMTLVGILHFVKVFKSLSGSEAFRISSIRFHVVALVGEMPEQVFIDEPCQVSAKQNSVISALQASLLDEFKLKVDASVDDARDKLRDEGIVVDRPGVYADTAELEQLVTPPLLHMLPNVALCGQFRS